MWNLAGFSLGISVIASPVSPADVRAERAAIPIAIAQRKTEAAELFRASQQSLLLQRALIGISRIENKLASTATNATLELPELKFQPLGAKHIPLPTGIEQKSYTTHGPTNGMPNYLNRHHRRTPEEYLPAEKLMKGANVLTPKGTVSVPVCLSPGAVEDYLQFRCDRRIRAGGYWSELHAGRLDDAELARLRYYDYLDANIALRPVPVYQCRELQSRNR